MYISIIHDESASTDPYIIGHYKAYNRRITNYCKEYNEWVNLFEGRTNFCQAKISYICKNVDFIVSVKLALKAKII